MKREEAIKKLADIIFDVSELGDIPYDTEDEQCAMNIARRRIDELFPQLPSNLDEAAKQLYPIITEEAKSDEWKIANREYNDMCIKLQDAFRKGAEWMARQGEKEIVMDKHIPERIFLWKNEMNEFLNGERKQVQIGINQDNLPGLLTYVLWKDVSQKVEQPEVDKFDCPTTPIEEAIEVTSRMQHIDEEMKPIAKFIMDYASWNLHKDEWNHPVIEVPLFRVLDALVQMGKPYCDAG